MYDTPTATMTYNYWLVPIITRRIITPLDIIKAGANAFHCSIEILLSPCRNKEVVRARNIIMYIIKKKLELTLTAIGKLFNRDHTTVLHSITSIDNDLSLMHTRQQMNEDLRKVMELI